MPEELPNAGDAQDVNAMAGLMDQASAPPDDLEDSPEPTKEEPTKDEPKEQPNESDKSAEKSADDTKPEPDKEGGEDDATPAESTEGDDEPEEKAEEDEDNFDREVDQIRLRKDASPRTQEALKVIKQKAKDEHAKAKEFQSKVKEYEDKLKDYDGKVLTPEMQQDYEELRSFRQAFDIEHDPEFTQQFEQPIQQTEANALNLLRSWRLPDSAAKYIQDHGGVLRFRTSQELMPPSVKNDDGGRMTQEEFWNKKIMNNISPAQKEDIQDHLLYLRQLHRGKQQAVQNAKVNREAYMQQSQQRGEQESKEWTSRIQAHAQKTLQQYGEIAKTKEMPKNPTPEQKASVEKHNARIKTAEAIATKYLTDLSPENLTEAAIAIAYERTVSRAELKTKTEALAQITKERDELQQRMKDIKESGRTVTKGRETSVSTKQVDKPVQTKDDEAAMTELLSKL